MSNYLRQGCIGLACMLFTVYSTAQTPDTARLNAYQDTLSLLAYAMVNSERDTIRFASCHKFIPLLVEALKSPKSFDYDFDRLTSISIQYPKDSTFRIFTWQLVVGLGEHRYFGALQFRSDSLNLVPLIDRSFKIPNKDAVLTNNEWYGALYYNIVPFEDAGKTKYLLFGFNHRSMANKRKIVDVLSFDNGKPTFGSPVFVKNTASGFPETRHRIEVEYKSDASVGLNYDQVLQMIVHDHLMPVQGRSQVFFVPDGTYEGYKWMDGKWMHVEKIFHETIDEPPRPEPVLDGRTERDITGRKKESK